MMKKTYQAPVTEIVELNVIDTIATSATPDSDANGYDGMGNKIH